MENTSTRPTTYNTENVVNVTVAFFGGVWLAAALLYGLLQGFETLGQKLFVCLLAANGLLFLGIAWAAHKKQKN